MNEERLKLSDVQKMVLNQLEPLVKEHKLDGIVSVVFKQHDEGVDGYLVVAGYFGVKSYQLLPLAQSHIEEALKMISMKSFDKPS